MRIEENTNNLSSLRIIGIVGTNGLPPRYGGWESLVNHLTIELKDRYAFVVYTSTYTSENKLKEYNGARLKYIRLRANGIQSIFYDMVSLFHACYNCEIILVLGTSGCIFFPLLKVFRKKVILNPDGLEWKRDKWNKPAKMFLKLSEKIGVRFSDLVITDNLLIQQYIRKTYKRESTLIEYGGDQASFVKLKAETVKQFNLPSATYAFSVCRIEPENNIHIILEAFKKRKLNLVIVGNWKNSNYGISLQKKFSSHSNIKLFDPIFDQTLLNELRSNCSLYIHGHSAGGTNPSLVEAMYLGLPIVAFNVGYNRETTENNALFFTTVYDLEKIIDDFSKNKIDLLDIKTKVRSVAFRRYKWNVIANKYARLFI